MYHLFKRINYQHLLTIVLLLLSAVIWLQPVLAEKSADLLAAPPGLNSAASLGEVNSITSSSITPSTNQEVTFPLVLRRGACRHRPNKTIIYQYDNKPLGDRRPFLLVHGLRGEYYYVFRWEKLIKRFKANADFARQYKIYLLRYDTVASVNDAIPQFRSAVNELYQATHKRPISVLALSIGGNLVFDAMHDKQTNDRIKLLMTLGTPFHGSPLFCSDWIQYGMYKNASTPFTRVDHSLAYRLYFHRNPTLLKDYRWDNCDDSIPNIGPFASALPFGPAGNLTVQNSLNDQLVSINSQGFDRKKLVTYSGYILNPYLLPDAERFIEDAIMAPYTLATISVPAHLAREHPVLKMLNREIDTIVATPEAVKRARTPFVFDLNDGITPLSSALFLNPEICKSQGLSKESDIAKLRNLTDVRTARIFRNIDHLTFIDGFRPVPAIPSMRDELNPEAGSRDIFNWMLLDIAQSSDSTEQLARD
jgi:hypothetical protein